MKSDRRWTGLILTVLAVVISAAGSLSAFADAPEEFRVFLPIVGSLGLGETRMAAPSAPTILFCEGMPNPLYVVNPQPVFSALFQDADVGDYGYYYQIQVDDDPAFASPIWDSGKTSMPHVAIGNRCDDITYNKEQLYGGSGQFLVGSGGSLYRWNDANAWEEVAPKLGGEGIIYALTVSGGKIFGAAGGKLYRWNEADAWEEVAPSIGKNIYSLATYNDKIYGGTYSGGKLLEWNDVDAWVEVAAQLGAETGIYSLIVYNGHLYGGTNVNGKLYQWNDVDAWIEVAPQLGAETGIYSLVVYNNQLYGGTANHGKLYRWNDVDAWVEVAPQLGSESIILSLAVHDGELYGGTNVNGKLYHWNGVNAWEEVAPGFGSETAAHSLASYNGNLYGGMDLYGELYRWNGIDAWEVAAPKLYGNQIPALAVYGTGGTLVNNTAYYWRIKFWDQDDNAGAWSTEQAYFLYGGLVDKKSERYYGQVANGYIEGESAVYATARAISTYCSTGPAEAPVGQRLTGGTYYVWRTYLTFDTSKIPDDAIIYSATLYIKASADYSTADFLIKAYRLNWASPLPDHREENYDNAYGALATLEGSLRNTADGWTDGTYYNLALATGGINKGGYTQYVLVSQEDVDNSAPVGAEYVLVHVTDAADERPYLEVVYTIPRSIQEIYGRGHDAASDTQVIYGSGDVEVEDEEGIFGAGIDDASDEQEIWGDGHLDTSDTQTIYGAGVGTVSDTQTIYGSGKVTDTQEIYGYGGTTPPELTWLNIYDSSGVLKARVFEWDSLQYGLESNHPGILTLKVPNDAEGVAELVNGNRIEVYRNGETVWAGIIARPDRSFDETGDASRYITINAMHFNWLPYWRHIVRPSGQDYLTCTDKVDNAIKYFVRKSLEIGSATPARYVPGFTVEQNSSQHANTKTLAAAYQDNLGVLLEKWSKAYDIDWWVEPNIPNNTYIFRTKVPRKGMDRSDSAIFTVQRHTLLGLEQWQDDLDTASVVYVGGPGEGSGQVVRTVYDGSEPMGWDRRETFVAAADAEYTDELDAAGHAWLDSFGSALEGIRFQLNQTEACKWRRHFDLGDLVRVYDPEWSIDKTAEIKAITVTVDADGIEDIELTVGEPQPSQWELLEAGIGPYSSFADNSAPATPTGLAVTTGTRQDTDGHWGAYLRATWSANAELDLDGYEVKYTIAGQESAKRVPKDQLSDDHFPVTCGASYSVTVRAVDTSGNASAYCTAQTGTTAKDLTPPATPTNLTVTAKKKAIFIKVDKNTEPDWAGNEFHVSTTNNFTPSSSTLVHSGKTTSFTYETPTYATYYVKVRAYDTASTPNYSAYTVQVSATPERTETDDIIDDAITTKKLTDGSVTNAKITNIAANKITTGTLIASVLVEAASIKAGSLAAGVIYTGRIDCDQLNAGVISAAISIQSAGNIGFQNGPQLYGSGGILWLSGRLRCELGCGGSSVYIYDDMVIDSSRNLLNINYANIGTYIVAGGHIGAGTYVQANTGYYIGTTVVIDSNRYLRNVRIIGGSQSDSVRWDGALNVNGEIKAGADGISWFTSDLRVDGDLDVWGAKNAIVKSSQGPVRLSAIESPEVWFVDVITDGGIDPLFDEVTEGDRYYVPVYSSPMLGSCPSGWLAMRRRKGYRDLRFGKEGA